MYIIDDSLASRINPISKYFHKGTEYRSFDKETDLKLGAIVFASLFAGNRAGYITDVSKDRAICKIAGQDTLVSDIQYIITKIKTPNIGETL